MLINQLRRAASEAAAGEDLSTGILEDYVLRLKIYLQWLLEAIASSLKLGGGWGGCQGEEKAGNYEKIGG